MRQAIAQQFDQVPLSDLIPHPRNPRKGNVAAIKDSILANGFYGAVVAQRGTNYVLAGNHRLIAAKRAGMGTVPVLWLDVDEDRALRILLADNRTNDLAGYDDGSLLALLEELRASNGALLGTGYDDGALRELLESVNAKPVPEDPGPRLDEAEALRKAWGVEHGQVWEIGKHRLMCGDATSKEDVARLLAEGRPSLMVTDPPYGVEYDPAWRNVAAAKGNLSYAARRVGPVANDDRADWSTAWALFPGDVVYSWHPAGATSLVHAAALQNSGFAIRMQIIWAKSNFPIGRGDYHVRHEPCWYAVREGRPSRRTKDRTQTTLWEINFDKNIAGGHSTQKPLECMERPIRNHSGDVYDPFVGSGTTLVAAERQKRRCWAMDIDPAYCAVSLQRLKDMGLEPTLIADGSQAARETQKAKVRKRRSAAPTRATA